MATKALTSEQVKARFRARGQSIAAWARQHADKGWTLDHVYRVLNGQQKGHRGRAHDIAVALGLKVEPSTELSEANSQTDKAA